MHSALEAIRGPVLLSWHVRVQEALVDSATDWTGSNGSRWTLSCEMLHRRPSVPPNAGDIPRTPILKSGS